jgi:hypothetical protein
VINGKQVYLGAFAKEEDAARAYNEFVQHGTCNVVPKQEGSSSKFRGVCWRKNANKWVAQRVVNGKKVYLRYYAKEEDAARAHINFVQHGTRNFVGNDKKKQRGSSSRFRGVSWNKASGTWRATLDGRYLGLFRDEKDAARRYNDEVRKLGRPADQLNAIDEEEEEKEEDYDDDNRGDHDDTEGASMRSGATGTVAAATAAAAAAATAQLPKPAAAPIAPIARSSTELSDAAAMAHIKALEAKVALKAAAAELEDARAALAAKRFERSSSQQ